MRRRQLALAPAHHHGWHRAGSKAGPLAERSPWRVGRPSNGAAGPWRRWSGSHRAGTGCAPGPWRPAYRHERLGGGRNKRSRSQAQSCRIVSSWAARARSSWTSTRSSRGPCQTPAKIADAFASGGVVCKREGNSTLRRRSLHVKKVGNSSRRQATSGRAVSRSGDVERGAPRPVDRFRRDVEGEVKRPKSASCLKRFRTPRRPYHRRHAA
eukprot:scaffold43212_cov71-Phaeocystis_antarctica.AAC.5